MEDIRCSPRSAKQTLRHLQLPIAVQHARGAGLPLAPHQLQVQRPLAENRVVVEPLSEAAGAEEVLRWLIANINIPTAAAEGGKPPLRIVLVCRANRGANHRDHCTFNACSRHCELLRLEELRARETRGIVRLGALDH